MNIVTAVLLIFVTEEVAFWILHHFCHRSLPGYYSADMHGAVLDQTVFEVLVRRHLPRLADHLSAAGVQLSMATLPWFLTLFIGTFELPYALRILDCVFLEGAPFLFRLGLAILAEAEEDIKENGISDEGGLVACLRSFCLSIGKKPVRHISRPESGDDIRISAFQALIQRAQYAYGDFVTIEVIEALRQEHKLKVIQGIADYTKKSIMRETIDGLDVSPRGRRSRSPSAESLAIGPLFLPPPAAELTLETISKAVSFYYDVFSSVLYYNDPGAKFSYGLDVDGFLSFLQPIVQWKVSEGVHVPKGITKEPSAILTFCVHLFGNSGKERSGRISFGESCHLLLDRLYLPSEDTARFIGYELFAAFSTTGDAMEYNDGLIKVTDALVSMIGEDEDQEDPMRAAFGLLKTFPMDKPISRDAFMATLSESPTLWMFLGGWARNHVRIEPIRGVSSHGPAQSPSLLSNLWTQMKGVSPWKGGTSSTKADDHSLTTDGISSAVKAASSLAVIRTPEVFTKDISARASPEETTDDASLLPDLLNLSLGQPTDSKGS